MDLVTLDDVASEPASGREVAAELAASGALDDVFARIDAGEIDLTGSDGLISGLIKAALERGLQADRSRHLTETKLIAALKDCRPYQLRDVDDAETMYALRILARRYLALQEEVTGA